VTLRLTCAQPPPAKRRASARAQKQAEKLAAARRWRRKPKLERPPPMLSPLKALFAGRKMLSPSSLGLPPPSPAMGSILAAAQVCLLDAALRCGLRTRREAAHIISFCPGC